MQNYIHETMLRDLIEIINDVKSIDNLDKITRKSRSMKSLSKSAADMVMVYPVITTNSINIDTAQLVTKAIERKAVSMLRMVFAANQFANSDDVREYLSKFHVNLDVQDDLSVDNILDTIDKFVLRESYQEGAVMLDKKEYKALLEADLKNDTVLPSTISESSISDYTISSIYGKTTVLKEADDDVDERLKLDREKFDHQRDRDARRDSDRQEDNIYRSKRDSKEDRRYGERRRSERQRDEDDRVNRNAQILQKNLLDNEVRKANELVETQMLVQVIHKHDTSYATTNVIIGVKAKMHPLDSIDIIERIYTKNKDRNFFMKFIQATTREISFMNDFLFAIEKAKVDALSVSKRHQRSSDLWKVLERRALKSKFKRRAGMQNNAMAITTLVVSQEEVEYLDKEYNIDLEDVGIARGILDAYNLLCLVIVDEAAETAKFLFDSGQDLYETLSFNALERESSNTDYKRMLKVLAKS